MDWKYIHKSSWLLWTRSVVLFDWSQNFGERSVSLVAALDQMCSERWLEKKSRYIRGQSCDLHTASRGAPLVSTLICEQPTLSLCRYRPGTADTKATGNPSWDQTTAVGGADLTGPVKAGAATFREAPLDPPAPPLRLWETHTIVCGDIYSQRLGRNNYRRLWSDVTLTSPCHSDNFMEPNCIVVWTLADKSPCKACKSQNKLKQRVQDWAEEAEALPPPSCLTVCQDLHLFLLLFERRHRGRSGFSVSAITARPTRSSFPSLFTFFSAQTEQRVHCKSLKDHKSCHNVDESYAFNCVIVQKQVLY